MASNFYQTNNEILKLDPFNEKDLLYLKFNQWICRRENMQRIKNNLARGTFELSISVIEKEFEISRNKTQRLLKWFEDNGIIECIEKSKTKGISSIYAYTSVYYDSEKSNTNRNTNDNTNSNTNECSDTNGSRVVDNTNSNTNSNTNGNTSKKEKEKEKKKEVIYSIAFAKIYEHWNSKNIVGHKGMKDYMVKAYNKAREDYSDNEIVEAITNYDKCLNDENFRYTWKFTLETFLKQYNGLPYFTNEGQIYINYLNQNKKATTGIVGSRNNNSNKSICKNGEKDSYKNKFKGEWL